MRGAGRGERGVSERGLLILLRKVVSHYSVECQGFLLPLYKQRCIGHGTRVHAVTNLFGTVRRFSHLVNLVYHTRAI